MMGVACDGGGSPESGSGAGGLTGAAVGGTEGGSTSGPSATTTSASGGVTTAEPGSSSEGPVGSTGEGGSSSESGDDGFMGTTSGVDPVVKCQAVDFMFVIDNSISMGPEQEALVGAFPGFMETIQTELEAGSDYHVMVLDTDAWGRCDTGNEPPWQGSDPDHNTCDAYITTTAFEECDRIRGAGVVHPAGGESSNMLCTPSSGGRYIDATEPDLPSMFECMATVGLAGHPSERPMNAIQEALLPGGEAEPCNEGFLRDDALLVITFISDDPGTPDQGTPMDWYDSVVAAKGGDPTGVVVLGLGPADPACGGVNGLHWLSFVELWGDHGIHGPVCGTADDYVQFFQDSVSVIDQACEEFVPG